MSNEKDYYVGIGQLVEQYAENIQQIRTFNKKLDGIGIDSDWFPGVDKLGSINWSVLRDHLKPLHDAASNCIKIKAALLEAGIDIDTFSKLTDSNLFDDD